MGQAPCDPTARISGTSRGGTFLPCPGQCRSSLSAGDHHNRGRGSAADRLLFGDNCSEHNPVHPSSPLPRACRTIILAQAERGLEGPCFGAQQPPSQAANLSLTSRLRIKFARRFSARGNQPSPDLSRIIRPWAAPAGDWIMPYRGGSTTGQPESSSC